MKKITTLLICTIAAVCGLAAGPMFTADASHSAGKVSPILYGLMTEEINHSYDGGLYAELLRNRAFMDDGQRPVHWNVAQSNGASAAIAIDPKQPLNSALPTCLRLDVASASASAPAGV